MHTEACNFHEGIRPPRAMGAIIWMLVAGYVTFAGASAMAQGGTSASHTVGQKDDVMAVAKKYKYPDVSLNQMALALVRANPDAFELNSTRQLKVGYAMAIPPQASVASTDAGTADKEVARLRKADASYRAGVAAERKGNMNAALRSYLTAAHMGHGLADYRLGQLYDRDNTGTVPHDLQESINFYQEARKRGITIDGPMSRAPKVSGGR